MRIRENAPVSGCYEESNNAPKELRSTPSGLKRTATTTTFAGVRIVEFESAAQQVCGEVHFGALQVEHALHVDGDFNPAFEIEEMIVVRCIFVKSKRIGQP